MFYSKSCVKLFWVTSLLAGAMLGTASGACIKPSRIEAGEPADSAPSNGISSNQVTELLDGTTLGNPLPYLFLPLADSLITALATIFETPIQFRQALYQGKTVYNVAAMYHPTALDIWGKGDKRICIQDFETDLDLLVHEQLATAYAFAYSATIIAPSSKGPISHIMDNVLKLPLSKLFDEPIDSSTPWGLARLSVDEMTEFSKDDGWNSDGSLTHTHNKMPFSDFAFKAYSPYETSPNKPRSRIDVNIFSDFARRGNDDKERCFEKWYWEPLLETNGNGYFTKQEHVTPFAGFTGRLYGMSASEYNTFSVSEPNYNYCEEANFVLSETNDMANDDRKKAGIELFNSKFTSLLPMQINWSIKNRFTSFEFWFYDMALVTAMYDAMMLVWREKVAFNAVRPPTVISALKGEEEVQSFAGPFAGSGMITGFDWQPYVRTMPHAEYPSGSSCICTAYAETLQLLTGEDSTGEFSVGMTVEAGSSKTEPGASPASDINFEFFKWSEIQEVCGQSRLHGGMHFSKAVPAGEELCTGVASLIVKKVESLKAGSARGRLADNDDTSIIVKTRTSCVNNHSYLYNLTRSCENIGRKESRRNRLCSKDEVRKNCPATCGICCGNTKGWVFTVKNGGKQNCNWLGNKSERQARYCHEKVEGYSDYGNGIMEEMKARKMCPEACNYCGADMNSDS